MKLSLLDRAGVAMLLMAVALAGAGGAQGCETVVQKGAAMPRKDMARIEPTHFGGVTDMVAVLPVEEIVNPSIPVKHCPAPTNWNHCKPGRTLNANCQCGRWD